MKMLTTFAVCFIPRWLSLGYLSVVANTMTTSVSTATHIGT